MVKNKRAKGNRNQRKCITELEQLGWQVSVVERTGRFIKEKDMWGLFDIACIKGNKMKIIQIKTNSTGGILHKIKDFAQLHLNPYVSYELWVWIDRKGWKRYIFDSETLPKPLFSQTKSFIY